MPITGGCACGAVRYECSADPIMAANCYCRDCQHSTGTAMASVMLIPKAALKITGELKQYESTGDSGARTSSVMERCVEEYYRQKPPIG